MQIKTRKNLLMISKNYYIILLERRAKIQK